MAEAFCPYYWFVPKTKTSNPSENDDEGGADSLSLTEQMRQRTMAIHDLSDKLVSVKLAFIFANGELYRVALLNFYHIFVALECMLRKQTSDVFVALENETSVLFSSRIKQFENDLDFYYNAVSWKDIQPTSDVVSYITHLQHLQDSNAILLLPYIYHLSLALLAGGQVMKKMLSKGIENAGNNGVALFEYDGQVRRSKLKRDFKANINNLQLDSDTRELLLNESVLVFKNNNKVIKSLPLNHSYLRLLTVLKYVGLIVLAMYCVWTLVL